MKFNKGDCVEVNGTKKLAIILNCYEDNMYIRLFLACVILAI